jgi:hypothetical protein
MNIVVYFKSLPTPIKWSSYIYVLGLLSYNMGSAYIDSKNALDTHNSKQFTDKDSYNYDDTYTRGLKLCRTEWDAAKFGASYNSMERLCYSIIFPVKLVSNIVPNIVVFMNKKNN